MKAWESEGGGYKYRMMQWCNDVRARERCEGRQALFYK